MRSETTWRAIYDRLEAGVRDLPNLRVPHTLDAVVHAPTSFQFMADLPSEVIEQRLAVCRTRRADHGSAGLKRQDHQRARHWGYVEARARPKGDAVLVGLCDIRLPSDLTEDEVDTIVAKPPVLDH